MSDFVDIVRFQLEKVHAGVLQWLLETKDSDISI
jgi:hypothetical protein